MDTLPPDFITANVGIIAHGDADGICSSAIIKSKYPGALVLFSTASQLHKVIKNLEKRVITLETLYIVDVAINPKASKFVLERLAKVKQKYEVIFIDNHLLPWEITEASVDYEDINEYVDWYLRRENWSSSALTFSLLFGDGKEDIMANRPQALLGTYGAISDYAKDCELVEKVLSLWDESVIYYQAFLLKQASRVIKSDDLKRVIADKLSVGILPSEMAEVVEAAREASREVDVAVQFIRDHAQSYKEIGVVAECPVASMGHNAFVTSTMTGRPVGVALRRKAGKAFFVLRRQHHESIHLGRLATKVARDLDCDGGGEEATAGITADDSLISVVLDRINVYVEDYLQAKRQE